MNIDELYDESLEGMTTHFATTVEDETEGNWKVYDIFGVLSVHQTKEEAAEWAANYNAFIME